MAFVLNPNMQATPPPPVMEARRWIDGKTFSDNRPLINVSQADPVDPPPENMRAAMADIIQNDPSAHLYGPVLGLPELRAEVAATWSQNYGGTVTETQVAITSGCNQAFTAVMSTLAGPGDEVILPTPWYFNHKMWLDMAGITAVPLPAGDGLLPDVDTAAAKITDKTRAIILVTPNNPAGVEYPPALVAAFRDLARANGLPLIIDETYRDFHSTTPGAPVHDLFADPDWDDTVICLYSFSKSYRLTGHRVGAAIASERRLAEIEKFLDTVAICPNQLGQRAALWGMRNLGDWLAGERLEILDRRAAISEGFPVLAAKGWTLLGVGAYFAYVAHPFDMTSDKLAPALVDAAGVLCLPGTMFMPESDPAGGRQIRIAFANIDRHGIDALYSRLSEVTSGSLAPGGHVA
jgi:aspartate/methionine/tyrosine aminotransferase